MSDDNQTDDDGQITVTRDRKIVQTESLTIKSKRGTGTNDRDEVRAYVEREAELDVPDEMMDQIPDLISQRSMASEVADVAETMAELRETNNE